MWALMIECTFFFFFKQKTAYEMRISDWSSDVCSSDLTLTKKLRSEVRQLRRYGGRPTLVLCGSAAIERLEAEIHEKGVYTQTGFINKGATDIGMADISMRGVGTFVYDPTLDALGREDFIRSDDRRAGEEWVGTIRYRWAREY